VAPSKRINQFPFENVLTIKDLLCVVCRRMGDNVENNAESQNVENNAESRLETSPTWLPTTFNLKTELPKFVSYFQQREKL
jgi:tubulin--tyrosine ligase-like protein 12